MRDRSSSLPVLVTAPVYAERHEFGIPRAHAVAYLIDPDQNLESPPALLQRLFDLTPAEARIALHIGNGLVPKEAAVLAGVSWETARTQLRQVFAKTGTDRQASLVRLLVKLGMVGDAIDQEGTSSFHPPE